MDFKSIDTWDKITSFIGFVITIITLFVANNARRAIKKVQNTITFDKRIPQHLREIDKMLTTFNDLLNNQSQNTNEINTLLGLMSSELKNLGNKVSDREIKALIKQANTQTKDIRRLSYTPPQTQSLIRRVMFFFSGEPPNISDLVIMNYIKIGEIYTAVNNIHKDSQTRIRR